MDTALLNANEEVVLKEVFTIEEVACALAGVRSKAADSDQVTRHERDLMNAIQRQVLPATYAYVDHDRTLIDWQTTRITRQALLNWCKHRGIPLAALAALAALATPKPKRTPAPQNNNRKALLQVIAGLTLLLADASSTQASKSKSNLNKRQLQNYIRRAIDKMAIPSADAGRNAFTGIFDDAFYEEVLNIIHTAEGSENCNQPASDHRRKKE
jgi:hypothetical protein